MRLALAEARLAFDAGEVPVGAVAVYRDQVVGRGHNRKETQRDPTAHAEVLALREAARTRGGWRLANVDLYCTMEPCPMCAGAIVHARVKRVVFAARDPRTGAAGSVFDLLPSDQRFNHYTEVDHGIMSEEASGMLSSFFRKRRQQKLQQKKSESQK